MGLGLTGLRDSYERIIMSVFRDLGGRASFILDSGLKPHLQLYAVCQPDSQSDLVVESLP